MFDEFKILRLFKYNNILVFASLKCGTRFLKDTNLFTELVFSDGIEYELINAKEIYWVIRNPLDHFLSAIVTGVNSGYSKINNLAKSSKLQIKKRQIDFVVQLVGDVLENIESNTKGIDDTIYTLHYEESYKKIFDLITTEYKIFYKTKFIELKNLSKLLKYKFNSDFEFNEEQYSFELANTKITKNDILGILINNYNTNWKERQAKLNIEGAYYNKILTFDFREFLIRKVFELEELLLDEKNRELETYISKISLIHNSLKHI
jgi:hypothetical protein